jgi:hypothetical protein
LLFFSLWSACSRITHPHTFISTFFRSSGTTFPSRTRSSKRSISSTCPITSSPPRCAQ